MSNTTTQTNPPENTTVEATSKPLQGQTTTSPDPNTSKETNSANNNKTTTSTTTNNSNSKDDKKVEQKQDELYTSATTPEYTTNNFLNVKYSLLDGDIKNGVPMQNGKTYNILGYIVPKFNLNNKTRFSSKSEESLSLRLRYNSEIKTIILQDRLDSIGLKGFVQVQSNDSYLDMFLERHNNFFFILNFTEVSDNKSERYQPYIFDISWVEQLSNPQSNERKMRIHLVDCMTAILKTHSIASVIRFNNNIVSATSYKSVFRIILDYIKCYMKINSNVTCDFKKDLLYKSNVLCGGVRFNGNDLDVDMSHLVRNTFGKIKRNASIYQAMDWLLKDCVTALKVPKSFGDSFQSIGDVLIPFFFKEEYPDKYKLYPSFWIDGDLLGVKQKTPTKPTNNQTNSSKTSTTATTETGQTSQGSSTNNNTTTPINQTPPPANSQSVMPIDEQTDAPSTPTANNGASLGTMASTAQVEAVVQTASNTGNIMKNTMNTVSRFGGLQNQYDKMFNVQEGGVPIKMRQITLRDFFMPFYLCFGADKSQNAPYAVYDAININPKDSHNSNLLVMNTYYNKESVKDMQFDPLDLDTLKKIWKNVIFIDCSSSGNGGNSTLIYFNWFYQYFSQVFLNRNKRGFVSNVIPDFYAISKNANIGQADKQGKTFNSVFDEYNSYTYATQTDDTVNECLRHMGRNITSFVLLNDMYTFTIDGDIMRRPNEIVKFGLKNDNNGTRTMLPIKTAFNDTDYVFLYVRKVTHKFVGNTYENIMNCCKICQHVITQSK